MAEPRRITTTGAIRVAMLALIAIICLASVQWSDPDLWIPFVCIIAVMGVGTRGGVLDSLGFVLIEAAVVVVLGVATFSGSRDFIWAASVAVSLVAVGKIALLELTKDEPKPDEAKKDAPKAAETAAPAEPKPEPSKPTDAEKP